MTDAPATDDETRSPDDALTTDDAATEEAPVDRTEPGAPPRVTAPPQPFDADPALETVPSTDAVEEADADEAPEPELVESAAADDEPGAFEDLSELPALLEALLFVADHPVETSYLARAVEVSVPRIEYALDALAESLRESRRGVRIQRGPQGVLLVSAPEAATQVERFLGLEATRRLSTAALETLAIIAYRQPITRGQVDAIRGVSSDGAVATLRARDLIESAGHAAGPGRPMLFRTTQRFLEHFGLERPGQLPALPDDIDLPAAEISAQLGLDEAAVAAAMQPPVDDTAPEDDATPEGEAAADLEASADIDDALAAAIAPDIEIPADLQALSEAAEHAFEASRERSEPGGQ